MSVNQNSANEATIAMRSPGEGSCWTLAQLQEFARLLVVKFPTDARPANMVVSNDTANLASLDASGAIFVQSVLVYTDTKTLAGGAGIGPLIFEGWTGIDATTSFLEVMLYLAVDETGVTVSTPVVDVNAQIRPNWEIIERIANRIKIVVYNATLACSVSIRLAQVPVPPAQS